MRVYFLIITAITFTLFFAEALIHFNIGRNGNGKPKQENYVKLGNLVTVHVPDHQEFVQIFVTVLAFSSVSGFLSAYILKRHLQ